MPALDTVLNGRIEALHKAHRQRRLHAVTPLGQARVEKDGRTLISFSGNDYFGLSQHAGVRAAAIEAIERYGAGAGASRLVCGNGPLYGELEAALAEEKRTQGTCVLGSGYLANLAAIATLAGPGDLILSDRLSHASLLDAARLSGARFTRFRHNDMADLRRLLAKRAQYRYCLIVTESVFSMDGDCAPLPEIAALAAEHDSWLVCDDAHGLGIVEPDALPCPVIHIGTLSKGLGAYGGYIAGSATLMAYLHTAARPLIYSTALPPPVLAAALAALRILQGDAALRERPLALARLFARKAGLKEPQSPIVPVILGDAARTLEAAAALEEAGYLVAAIRPPTVPEGTSRLRFSFSALHGEGEVEALSLALKKIIGRPPLHKPA